MKKVLWTVACALFMFSCTQDNNLFVEENVENVPVQTELTTAEAQTKFAVILSKAVSNSEEVRSFLKEEALAYFDNDNDVFYPFVKDKIVPGTGAQTFRNILLSYCDSEEELKAIEKSQPLLNILVPDLTLFWDFNAQKWDTSDNEVAVFCRNDETNSLYENGENIGQLPVGEIPGFPCLVIKNNERLRVNNAATRTVDGVGYEFISDAYDGSKRKAQTRDSYYFQDLGSEEDLDKPVSASELEEEVIKGYLEFRNVPSAYQRDYIYYGITKDNKPGNLRTDFREKLYRFRINKNAFAAICDDKMNSDPKLRDPDLVESFEKKGGEYTNAEILQRIWTDGMFEIVFKSTNAVEGSDNTAIGADIHLSCAANQLFSLDSIYVHHRNSTLFRHSKNTYFPDYKDLSSKWVYPEDLDGGTENNLVLTEPWDLTGKSMTIHLLVSEEDGEGSETVRKTIVNEYADKGDFSYEAGGGDDVKVNAKLGYGFSKTHSESSTVEYTVKVGSDDLGTITFHYEDPVITAQKDGGYLLYRASSGDVEATLLPCDIVQ